VFLLGRTLSARRRGGQWQNRHYRKVVCTVRSIISLVKTVDQMPTGDLGEGRRWDVREQKETQYRKHQLMFPKLAQYP